MEELTDKQNKKLEELLRLFERATERRTAVHWISGGFAHAEPFEIEWFDDPDEEQFIGIELKWGIQSDCENVVHTETYRLPVKVLDIDVNALQLLDDIQDW